MSVDKSLLLSSLIQCKLINMIKSNTLLLMKHSVNNESNQMTGVHSLHQRRGSCQGMEDLYSSLEGFLYCAVKVLASSFPSQGFYKTEFVFHVNISKRVHSLFSIHAVLLIKTLKQQLYKLN
jgi:hypothetical protein